MQKEHLTYRLRSRAAKPPSGVSVRRKPDRRPAMPQRRNRERKDSPRQCCVPA